MRLLLPPLVALAVAASYVAATGIDGSWLPPMSHVDPTIVTVVVSVALHAAWVVCAGPRRAMVPALACWLVCLRLAVRGFGSLGAPNPLTAALALEGIPLLLARALTPAPTWPDRLAHWRRVRADVLAQLEMSQGLIPWARAVVRRVFVGDPVRPTSGLHTRFLAELADADCRMHVRLSRAAMPEQLRQQLIAAAAELQGRAEVEMATAMNNIEGRALESLAGIRDCLERLDDISPLERARLASDCEELLLGAIGRSTPPRQSREPREGRAA